MDNSLFAKLPPELRNEIYDIALSADSNCRRPRFRRGERLPKDYPASICPPPLIQTCRKIRSETWGMYYAAHAVFEVVDEQQNADALAKWLANTPESTVRHIGKLRVVSLLGMPKEDPLYRSWKALCRALIAADVAEERIEWAIENTGGRVWTRFSKSLVEKREVGFKDDVECLMKGSREDVKAETASLGGFSFCRRTIWGLSGDE